MYSVTIFNAVDSEEEESVEAHPSAWLSPERKHCSWPNFKHSEALKNAIKKCLEPRATWASYGVQKVLYVCDELHIALRKAEKGIMESDLDTAASDIEKTKSRERRKKSSYSFDDSEDEQLHCSEKHTKALKTIPTSLLPPPTPLSIQSANETFVVPPILPQRLLRTPGHNVAKSSEYITHTEHGDTSQYSRGGTPTEELDTLAQSSRCSTPNDHGNTSSQSSQSGTSSRRDGLPTPRGGTSTQSSRSGTSKPNGLPARQGSTSTKSSRSGTSSQRDGLPDPRGGTMAQSSQGGSLEDGTLASQSQVQMSALSARDKAFLTHMVELKAQVQLNTQLLKAQGQQMAELRNGLATGSHADRSSVIPTPPVGVALPMQTFPQLQQFEKQLRTGGLDRKNLVAFLGLLGGVAVKDTARRILSRLFTTELAMQFNFRGHGTKHAFSELQLRDVVNDAVRCNRITSGANNDDVERVVREWLRTAKDRSGGRRRRENRGRTHQLVDTEVDSIDRSSLISHYDETDMEAESSSDANF